MAAHCTMWNVMAVLQSASDQDKTKHRRPRFSDREVEIMLICLEKQPELANGVLGEAFHSPLDQRMAWDAIAEALRSVSSAVRTGKDVRDKWRDLKSRAKQKAFRLKMKAGDVGKSNSPLTELEEKALSLAKLVTRVPAVQRDAVDGLEQHATLSTALSGTASSAEMSPSSPTPSFASYALGGCLQEMTTLSTPELNGSLIGMDEPEVKHLANAISNDGSTVIAAKHRPSLELSSSGGECSKGLQLVIPISDRISDVDCKVDTMNTEESCVERLANASAYNFDLEESRLQVEEQRLHVEEQRLQIEERRLQIEERRLQIKERQLQIEQRRFALLKN